MGRAQPQRRAQTVAGVSFERERTSWTIRKVGERQNGQRRAGSVVAIDDDAPKCAPARLAGERKAVFCLYRAAPKRCSDQDGQRDVKVETAEGHAPRFFRGKRRTPSSDRWIPSPWTARWRKGPRLYKSLRDSPAIINPSCLSGARKRPPGDQRRDATALGQLGYRVEPVPPGWQGPEAWTSTV